MKYCRMTLFVFLSVAEVLYASESSDSDWTVNVAWGIFPFADSTLSLWNGTALFLTDGDSEFPVSANYFTNTVSTSCSIGLLGVGSGEWNDGTGWLVSRWIDTNPYIIDASSGNVWIRQNGAPNLNLQFPINLFGDWHSLSPEGQSSTNRLSYYLSEWVSRRVVIVLRDNITGQAHVLSKIAGLTDSQLSSSDFLGDDISGLFQMSFVYNSLWPPEGIERQPVPQIYNSIVLVVSTPSKRVYIGPQIPPYCIWMADYELTQEYLATLPQGQVEAAFGLRKHPMDPYCVWMNEFGLTLADLETLRPELVALAYERGVSPSNPFCVWMVDWELTQEDLDSLDEDYVDFAFENRMDPRDDRCRWMYDFQLTAEYLATLPEAQVREAFERRVHPEDASFLRAFHATVFMMR